MSDTLDPAAVVTPAQEAPAPAPEADPAPAAPSEAAAAPDAPEAPPAGAEGEQKAKGGDRRFAVLTAKAAYDRQRAEAAEAELQSLKARMALLEAKPGESPPDVPKPPPSPSSDDVEARAAALLAQREAEQRRISVVQEGEKLLGAEGWKEKTDTLTDLGAFRTPDFLHALLEVPNAAHVAAELADNPEKLISLLSKRPTAMAAELGRMSAEIAAPKPKPISSAPAPVQPLSARGGPAPADIYDPKMSVKEYIALRNKTAPARLGGPRRRSA